MEFILFCEVSKFSEMDISPFLFEDFEHFVHCSKAGLTDDIFVI